jgi:predicted nucleic acid-binding protein
MAGHKLRTLWWVSIGAGAAYYLDPDRGRARRAELGEQVVSARKRRQSQVEADARYRDGEMQGEAARAAGGGVFTPEDDIDIGQAAHAALTKLELSTSDVKVDVVDGVATIRGQVGTAEDIDEVCRTVSTVTGVAEVRSYLHTPGTPAPNKAASLAAS